MDNIIKYKNGLRLIVSPMPSVKSVSSGIWIGAGSINENSLNNGISHFTEHMLFKGTKKLNPFQIASTFESMGAMVNAFTGKECTCYYVKSIDEYAEKCLSVLSDIFLNSVFDKEELDKERKVIVEEINMVEDSPEEICYDLLSKTLYPNQSIGQTILGSIENVKRFEKTDILKYMDEYYCANNIVISMAGNITLPEADKLVQKYFLPFLKAENLNLPRDKFCKIEGSYSERIKDFEQSNIAISYQSIKFNDKLFPVQAILNVILGGGMSSRLFQHIREQLGLAYSVYTSPTSYYDNGSFNIFLNITHTNTEKAVTAVKNEIDRLLKSGINNEEFNRAKAQIKSSLVFGQESVQTVMSSVGKYCLMTNQSYDVDERIAEINNVNLDDVISFANNLFSKPVSAVYVGKKSNVDILKLLS